MKLKEAPKQQEASKNLHTTVDAKPGRQTQGGWGIFGGTWKEIRQDAFRTPTLYSNPQVKDNRIGLQFFRPCFISQCCHEAGTVPNNLGVKGLLEWCNFSSRLATSWGLCMIFLYAHPTWPCIVSSCVIYELVSDPALVWSMSLNKLWNSCEYPSFSILIMFSQLASTSSVLHFMELRSPFFVTISWTYSRTLVQASNATRRKQQQTRKSNFVWRWQGRTH